MNDNDLISKAAAIDGIKKCPGVHDPFTGYMLYYTGVEKMIECLPAVDAVPVVHGRWLYEHDDPVLLPCSICGYQVDRYNNTRYCPNCGTKMDGERGSGADDKVDTLRFTIWNGY